MLERVFTSPLLFVTLEALPVDKMTPVSDGVMSEATESPFEKMPDALEDPEYEALSIVTPSPKMASAISVALAFVSMCSSDALDILDLVFLQRSEYFPILAKRLHLAADQPWI